MFVTFALGLALAGGPSSTELTIYNQGFGLVKEVRTFSLKQGEQSIGVEDVAAMIEPSSVAIKSLTGNQFRVLEQNYQYDLISPQAILAKSVGQRVRLVRTLGGSKDVLEGTLMSSPTAVISNNGSPEQTYNGLVIKTDDGRIVPDPTGEIEVTTIPPGLISKPTLIWQLASDLEEETKAELSYISSGMSWNADYVLTLDGVGKADLKGWVTINNQCGATFENAKLKLLAGEVNRVQAPDRAQSLTRDGAMELQAYAKPSFAEQSLFEYHLYTLQRPATIRNKETKQLSLLEGHHIPVVKKLVFDSMAEYGQYYPNEGEVGTGDLKAQVRLEFKNDEKSGLGMPLPKGKFRVYQRDKSGSVQLLGENQIDHTPRNEKLSLVVGKSFDVVANRKRTNFSRTDKHSVSESFEIEVRNRKESTESITLLERHFGDWKVTAKSSDFTKVDSNTMQFSLTLKPNEVRKVTYTVKTRY